MTCTILQRNSFISVSELDQYLDTSYTDELTLSKAAKTEVILAGMVASHSNTKVY